MTRPTVEWAPEVDLDGADPPVAPRRDTLLALCVALALVAVLASAAAHTALSRSRDVEPPRALVTVDVLDLVATPQPVAVLALTVLNRGNAALTTDTVQVSGAGLTPTTAGLSRRVEAGAQQVLTVRDALDCSQASASATAPHVVVRLGPAQGRSASTTADVVGVGVGDAASVGGLCVQASGRLASGAAPTVTVASARIEGPRLHLSLAGLPDGATLVSGRAADWLLPGTVGQGSTTVVAGRLDASLDAPVPGCRDTTALDVVPSGVQVVLVVPTGGLARWYAPVGPALAGWLLDAYARACPTSHP